MPCCSAGVRIELRRGDHKFWEALDWMEVYTRPHHGESHRDAVQQRRSAKAFAEISHLYNKFVHDPHHCGGNVDAVQQRGCADPVAAHEKSVRADEEERQLQNHLHPHQALEPGRHLPHLRSRLSASDGA